jgi:hypothetical protein
VETVGSTGAKLPANYLFLRVAATRLRPLARVIRRCQMRDEAARRTAAASVEGKRPAGMRTICAHLFYCEPVPVFRESAAAQPGSSPLSQRCKCPELKPVPPPATESPKAALRTLEQALSRILRSGSVQAASAMRGKRKAAGSRSAHGGGGGAVECLAGYSNANNARANSC